MSRPKKEETNPGNAGGQENYVSKEEFNKLEKSVLDGFSLIMEKLDKPEPHPEFSEKELKQADPVRDPINPRWVEKVHEILGPDFGVDVSYPDSGGTLFTVIVPKAKSNATQSYWEQFRENPKGYEKFAQDRRTNNIGTTGIDGVEKWCKLIKANLERKR